MLVVVAVEEVGQIALLAAQVVQAVAVLVLEILLERLEPQIQEVGAVVAQEVNYQGALAAAA